ncbi:SDR family oxidoreductase [Dactylosporangium vinaceum]|uniref:SDR family NAD(P)-dependent oxidoreductase n=1 Tax=Dactylosporangium vinaceum TaxID=53362 RepID=A0ABV5LZY6_9ACTN|nr:SDR family oxidoreductase [Dactylosporangium vinaceum]UAB94340.1 SDR family oxidoreductase [Dactylosporangium vinaceum]
MMLEGRTAVVYGGGGNVGGAMARAFARHGATVHLAGRTRETLRAVADDIAAAGGTAYADVVDALDERAVDAHTAAVMERSGRLDVSVNVIGDGDVQGTPMAEMAVADYLRPIVTSVTAKFITARAAARVMVAQGSGLILYFGGSFDWSVARRFSVGGMGVTFDAVESMRKQLAAELGRRGVRVVTLRTSGLPETIPADFEGRDELVRTLAEQTLTGRLATLAEVGELAAFAASDRARLLTGTELDLSG